MINVILAIDSQNGLGKNNKLPWNIPEEIQIFKEKTMNSIIIVGRKTLEKLPLLQGRTIFCISRNFKAVKSKQDIVNLFSDVESALEAAKKLDKNIFIIGGNQIYDYVFMNFKDRIRVHISFIYNIYECDTYFNTKNLYDFYITNETKNEKFRHCEMVWLKHGESQYLKLVSDLLKNGHRKIGRNGETISDFCKNLKFDLRNGFPLLTTKKMFTKGIIEELLFFIRGDTNTKILEEKGINIWKGNTNREFLDKNGFLEREEGEMGPMYGSQWRRFNGGSERRRCCGSCYPYESKEYCGFDLLKDLIREIKTDPNSRRHLLTTFNPLQVEQGVLYPCHSIIIQFYVQDGFIDMFCFNRSSDVGLGLPFNIASSSLFLMIVAKLTELTPRYFNLTLGDAHIYSNHEKPLLEQIKRIPYSFPKIQFPDVKTLEDVEKLVYEDFKINDYNHYESVKMAMSS
jgi:dihydrofolate reductase/thymidylate synthase